MNLGSVDLNAMTRAQKLALSALLDEKLKRTRNTNAQDDLLGFAAAVYPNYVVGRHHKIMSDLFKDVLEGKKRRVIVNVPPRFGKLLADETEVLTQNRGWVTHGDLRAGDLVFSPCGEAVPVVALAPKDVADVRVEFFDGSVFYCHENHEWKLFNHPRKEWEVREAGDFLKPRKGRWGAGHGKSKKQVLSGSRALHQVPLVSPLQYPAKELPVHPYVLGAWLGDGSAGKACVTHRAADQAYIDKIEACGYPVSSICVHRQTKVLTTYFSGPRPNVRGRLTTELQAAGIYKTKRIPEEFLRASVAQRLELLAGLIDTDGYVNEDSRCVFTSVNKALIDGVDDLAHSFGWRTTLAIVEPRLSSSGIQGKQRYWTIAFQPTLPIPTALPRKRILRYADRRMIGLKSVTRVTEAKTGRCIQVGSEDGMYLVGRNLIPTHNSELSSYLLPAWFLGHRPDAKIIMATHTASLSEDFGKRVRNLIDSEEYREVFPNTLLADDSKSAGSWNTTEGGKYFAAGVGGALAGRGADLVVIDDAHSEQQGKSNSKTVFDEAWSWYQTGPRQRLMWGGSIVVVMTRWSLLDLTGRLINYQQQNPDADQWEVIELPAILPSGKSLWPEKWPIEELKKTKATIEPRYWNAQYQQQPASDDNAIIKREWWREWPHEDPPDVNFVIQTWDTAHDTKTTNDYSACTTWGIFDEVVQEGPEAGKVKPGIILLNAFKERMEFPELKEVCLAHWEEWKPDAFIVEKKAAGAPLIQELRQMGIPVSEFTPSRGNDKISRVNAIADIFASGRVWAPNTRWAKEVIEECATFPVGTNDDYVDCTSCALLRYRQGRFITLESDVKDEPKKFKSTKHRGYY